MGDKKAQRRLTQSSLQWSAKSFLSAGPTQSGILLADRKPSLLMVHIPAVGRSNASCAVLEHVYSVCVHMYGGATWRAVPSGCLPTSSDNKLPSPKHTTTRPAPLRECAPQVLQCALESRLCKAGETENVMIGEMLWCVKANLVPVQQLMLKVFYCYLN